MTIDQAIELLKKTVKYSHLVGQKHLDMGLVPANQRDQVQKAMVFVRQAIASGQYSEEQFKQALGLD